MEHSAAQVGDDRRAVPMLRLILGSLAATVGLFLLGSVLASSSASADEPAPTNLGLLGGLTSVVGSVDGTLTSVVNTTTSTIDAVVSPVTAALPAPVSTVVDSVVTPTTDAVADVAGSGVVSQVVAPVATAADTIVSAVPGAGRLLGTDPVSSITAPTTGAVDGALGSVTGTVSDVLSPSVSTTPTNPGPILIPGLPTGGLPRAAADGTSNSATSSAASTIPELTAAATADEAATPFSTRTSAPRLKATPVASSAASGVPGDDPGGPGATHNQPDPMLAVTPAGASGSSSASGAGSGGLSASADVTSGADFFCQPAGIGGLPGSDVLPSSPAADHDLSPD